MQNLHHDINLEIKTKFDEKTKQMTQVEETTECNNKETRINP